ncbi:MAG: DUF5060 domain-containing protein [Planctomycetota bacterium]|nr:DUF5060 domain-containing protein [Planctomycetota bacterium]
MTVQHNFICRRCLSIAVLFIPLSWHSAAQAADFTLPIVSDSVVFDETDGMLAIEAEHFFKQTLTNQRAWHITSSMESPAVTPDGDDAHVGGAAGGAYIEALPDTRRTHDDKLTNGENFSNVPGKMAVLHYKAHFNTPGRYFVWARSYSTGPEDNGLHFGLDGEWPESGQRWQTVAKNGWNWDSKQRTEKVHTGVPFQLFLDIETAGLHELNIAMREDGFELDRFVLTTKKEHGKPTGLGPDVKLKSGTLPEPFLFADVALPIETVEKSESVALVQPRQPAGDGTVRISGELKQWHKVTLTLDGPYAHERDDSPNPFTDLAMSVTFSHESGTPRYVVPGYFAADGDAANSGAQSGTKWCAHLSPDKAGIWNYDVSVLTGRGVAVDAEAAKIASPSIGKSGSFNVAATDKTGRDFRAKGRLQYVGGHYLRHAGSGEYFLKAGPDAPETMLAYADFDDTIAPKEKVPLKKWQPHVSDWREGDPAWRDGKGKGLIGAINYLAAKRCNTVSFLPYNAGGDGDNVWPFVSRDDKLHYDCSKLGQWQIVFDHATTLGLHLHFKLQENEIDDNRRGHDAKDGEVKESLDGGKLGIERKLYCRELIARFGHELGLLWNIGEENTQSAEEQIDMIRYLHETDAYKHNIVIHTFPNQQDQVYTALLGVKSLLTGASLQNSWSAAHQRTLKWVQESTAAGRPWVVCNDEQNPASDGVPTDPGYQGHDGFAGQAGRKYTMHDVRKLCLWGTLMAGGGGVEYYFGYKLPENDLVCQDFRSRDRSWDYCRIALEFFRDHEIPFWEMQNSDTLVGNDEHSNNRFCFSKANECYLVYLPSGGATELNLAEATSDFDVRWFNPRDGGQLSSGTITKISGGKSSMLGQPPESPKEDWLVVVRRTDKL